MYEKVQKQLMTFPTPALSGSGSMGLISAFRHPFIYGGKNKVFLKLPFSSVTIFKFFSATTRAGIISAHFFFYAHRCTAFSANYLPSADFISAGLQFFGFRLRQLCFTNLRVLFYRQTTFIQEGNNLFIYLFQ